jgi:PAS domain-containing protein
MASARRPLPPSDSVFQSAFEYAVIGMALVAPNGAWLRVNRSLCEITGYTEVELLQRTFQLIPTISILISLTCGKCWMAS